MVTTDSGDIGLIILLSTLGAMLCISGTSLAVLFAWYRYKRRNLYQAIPDPIVFFPDEKSKYTTSTASHMM